jgi:hypothetical protein
VSKQQNKRASLITRPRLQLGFHRREISEELIDFADWVEGKFGFVLFKRQSYKEID